MMKTCIMKEVRWIPLRSQHDRVCTTQKAILRNNYGFIQLRGECGHGILMLVNSFNPSRREFRVPEYRRGVKDANTTHMATWARKPHSHVSKSFFVVTRLDFGQGVGKGATYRQSALIPTCDALNSIVH